MNRRDFIALLGGAAAAWPLAARGQQPLPVVGFVDGVSPEFAASRAAGFRKGLSEVGYVEGQNVTVEYHWLAGQYDRLPSLMADLVRRRVAVIATPGSNPPSLAAKAATTTIPIIFGVAEDPVKLGLVASLARPGSNATGINTFTSELMAKRLGLLHDLVQGRSDCRAGQSGKRYDRRGHAARYTGSRTRPRTADSSAQRQHQPRNRGGLREYWARAGRCPVCRRRCLLQQPARAICVARGAPRDSCDVYTTRDYPEVGGLMSYGTDVADRFRQGGVMTGQILKGAKPADLPVIQSTKFQFVINMQTARALGLEVPPQLLASADEVIE
jgi:ABC-type uncharacterized transport system substrate-binding protein